MADLFSVPFARWLEGGVESLIEHEPRAIVLAGILEDGSVLTGYYRCDCQDKAILAHSIYSDSVMDLVAARIDEVREALENSDADDQQG